MAQKFFKENPLAYAELAHQYPCCDIPQDSICIWYEDGVYCEKIGDYTPEKEE